ALCVVALLITCALTLRTSGIVYYARYVLENEDLATLLLLDDLKEEFGLTYLFIAHGLNVVKHNSDRVGVMYLGKLMEVADKREIYDNPLNPYTQAL
ncbi:hypothetical protein NE639_26910, partial [Blautia producta]|nr:hypothetical protein [Blautia producta]